MYAVVKTGGKQYRVEEGRAVKVERLAGEVGAVVELGDVLLMDDGGSVTVGTPSIAGARVLGTVVEQGRSKKVIVFRYKAKTRYRKKTGHRQHFTKVVVDDILLPGQEPKPKQAAEPIAAEAPTEEKKRGRRTAAEAVPTPANDEGAAEAAPEASAAEAPLAADDASTPPADEKPKRGRKKAE